MEYQIGSLKKNSDYIQLQDAKDAIHININSVTKSFVVIGYYLKYIRDRKMYIDDGFESIWELAQNEFGISKSQASKFMSINDKFSLNGNSTVLNEKYSNFSSSKLSEMLYLTEEQLEQVTAVTTVAEIREIKNPERAVSISKEVDEDILPGQIQVDNYLEMIPKSYDENISEQSVDEDVVSISKLKLVYEMKDCKFGGGKCNLWLNPEKCSGTKRCNGNFISEKMYLEVVSTSKQEELELLESEKAITEKTNVFEEAAKQIHIPDVDKRILTDVAKWCIEKLKDTLQLQIEVNGFEASMEKLLIMNLQTNAIKPVNNYSIFFSKTYVKVTDHEYDKTENLLYMDIDQEIHRIWFEEVGRDERQTVICEPETVVSLIEDNDDITDDEAVTELVENVPEYKETVSKTEENDIDELESVIPERSCSNCNYDTMGRDDYFSEHPESEFPCDNCGALDNWIPEIEIVKDEPEPVEVVEADIIQTVSEEPFTDQCKASGLKFNNWLKANGSSIADIVSIVLYDKNIPNKDNLSSQIQNSLISRLISKTEAYYNYLTRELGIEPERPKQIQPELPILKNNDQRAAFIDAYATWPLWIETKETGERYYRYDFDNNESFIIRVSLHHSWDNGKYSDIVTYGKEEYYILCEGKKKWESKNKTFCECNTNKTALIEYLKEFQKK